VRTEWVGSGGTRVFINVFGKDKHAKMRKMYCFLVTCVRMALGREVRIVLDENFQNAD